MTTAKTSAHYAQDDGEFENNGKNKGNDNDPEKLPVSDGTDAKKVCPARVDSTTLTTRLCPYQIKSETICPRPSMVFGASLGGGRY